MNWEWLWTIGVTAIVTAAGFWGKTVLLQLDKMQTTLEASKETLAKIGAELGALHNRVDRVEDFIDKIAERRVK